MGNKGGGVPINLILGLLTEMGLYWATKEKNEKILRGLGVEKGGGGVVVAREVLTRKKAWALTGQI
jgi:hypothetical protein